MFLLVKSNYKIKIKESFKKSSSPIEDLTVSVANFCKGVIRTLKTRYGCV